MRNACYYQAHDVFHTMVNVVTSLDRIHATKFGRSRNDIRVSNVSEKEVLRTDVNK